MVGSTRYEYQVALNSPTVLEGEWESYGPVTGGSAGGTGADIGAETAQTTALDHAGVKVSDAYELKVKREYEDGRLEYEVEFKSGGMEYEYTVDGTSGTILDYEQEWD